MNMFRFSKRSISNLERVHKQLATLAEEVLKISPFDFAITSGYRTLAQQQEMFAKKVSKCDGVRRISKHQEGKAIDIMVYDEEGKGTWEEKYYLQMAGVFKAVAKRLNIKIRCGVDFEKFFDGPHIELV